MRPVDLLREAFAAARCSPVPSALVALVVAATACVALITVGRQAALEADLARDLAGPSARTLTVTDVNGSKTLNPAAVAVLRNLSTVEAVVGSNTPVDVVNGAVGDPKVALVGLVGDIERAVTLTRGRLPRTPGEAVVSVEVQRRLGLAEPVGFLNGPNGHQWAIVGTFTPQTPFQELASMAVTTVSDDQPLRQVKTISAGIEVAAATQNAALGIVAAGANKLSVDSPLAAAAAGQLVERQVTGFGRSLLLLILGAGGFFVAVVVLADVLIRRRDLGRRRTLGITRADLVALVALRTAVPAGLGAAAGLALGLGLGAIWSQVPGLDFALAVAVLACLTALLAAIPPAVLAANRDPVSVMRTA
ncbi:MAG: hypothetical protein Q4D96_11245 [Propionibacteriaceae bacterium]|nr:hypothetical protein [Propionibacteriaceae bacterium]